MHLEFQNGVWSDKDTGAPYKGIVMRDLAEGDRIDAYDDTGAPQVQEVTAKDVKRGFTVVRLKGGAV